MAKRPVVLPGRVADLSPKTVGRFKAFLSERGAEVMAPTNPYEVLRFRANGAVAVVYRNANGLLNIQGDVFTAAWKAFRENAAWRGANRTKRRTERLPAIKALRARDGNDCFYCGEPVADADASVEHLVPVTAGGPDHIANMALAHKLPCNLAAGHLSVMEKIALRERQHAALGRGQCREVG